jgi:hypothetical protein
MNQHQHNKSLHPTAYSSVRSSLRFQQRVSSSVVLLARGVPAVKAFERVKLKQKCMNQLTNKNMVMPKQNGLNL